ncbi:hypothetical protein [Yoonia sediminilitoris]|uniref:CRISPR-associated protein Cas2 n=1 Tax=Yoonia sediminilitoris TaxID=1286148 RepID=A0A2T6KFT3_9RHOB|nr:hypothetical protein [Yoonia sediminilitoris]PUB14171.1 hypothetical protein C8N45_10644 [Yoonia sediminilitoris]RCW95102.1 hypothetical protein DFP92_10644 [Yoonia sediminilitoris]
MASFLISYDLNGPNPSHKQMDDLIPKIAATYGRVLETVWWVEYSGTAMQLRDRLRTTLRKEDSLMVCECKVAAWHNLLINDAALKKAIEAA